jgi:hypothetical protein
VVVTAIGPTSVTEPTKQFRVELRFPGHRGLTGTLWFQSHRNERRLTGLILGEPGPASTDPPPEVTTEVLRAMSFRKIQREVDEILAQWTERDPLTHRLTEGFLDSARPGRRGREDHEYAAVAEVYVKHLRSGSSAPVKRAAEELHLSVPAVRALLNKARKRNLLTASKREGLAGGELTKKAKRLLARYTERN